MKKMWIWIGIIVGVLVLVFLAAAPLVFAFSTRAHMPMMGGFRHPYASHPMFFFGGWLAMMARLVFPLLAVGLLVWGGYAIGRSASRRNEAHSPQVSQSPTAAKTAVAAFEPPATAAAPATIKTCTHCGGELQEGWVACPHCGEKI